MNCILFMQFLINEYSRFKKNQNQCPQVVHAYCAFFAVRSMSIFFHLFIYYFFFLGGGGVNLLFVYVLYIANTYKEIYNIIQC